MMSMHSSSTRQRSAACKVQTISLASAKRSQLTAGSSSSPSNTTKRFRINIDSSREQQYEDESTTNSLLLKPAKWSPSSSGNQYGEGALVTSDTCATQALTESPMSANGPLREDAQEGRKISYHHDLRNQKLNDNSGQARAATVKESAMIRLAANKLKKAKEPAKRTKYKSAVNGLVESLEFEEMICSCNLTNKSKVDETNNNNDNNFSSRTSEEKPLPTTVTMIRDDMRQEDEQIINHSHRVRLLCQPHKLVSLGERNGQSLCNKHMPWFGIDVGGSLIKVVFFDPKEATREEANTLRRIRRYLKSSKAYGTTGKRDAHLEMPNCVINKRAGTLHFIRFATSQMPEFLAMAKSKRFADTINTVCATGGGAYKFEEEIKSNLGISLHKSDELDSIIYGIHYIDKYNYDRECYYLEDPLDDEKCAKIPYDFSRPYPYLVVNIGSGISILAVYSSTSYSRISGSSIGGGTFLGLCCLLTQCKTFDEAIRLAKAGSSAKIDKLVKDIYGGDYPKFNLSGDTVASSFGHMNMAEKRKEVKREDLARALLEMVTINIGSIARMCAANEDIDRVVFIGNFLRVNQLSMKLLSYAVNYWSKGAMKALFLEHEGYFGAVGCFVESTQGCHH